MRHIISYAAAAAMLFGLASCSGQDYSGLDRIDDVVAKDRKSVV